MPLLFENKLSKIVTENSFEINTNYSSYYFKILMIIFFVGIISTTHVISFNNKTDGLFFLAFGISLAVFFILYMIFVKIFKERTQKFEYMDDAIFLNGKAINMNVSSCLKLVYVSRKRGERGYLYLITADEKINLVFDVNIELTKEVAKELSEFLKIKLDRHYNVFSPIW